MNLSPEPLCRNLQLYKQKAVGAKKGYELLKKKSDALKKAFRACLAKIVEAKVKMSMEYKEASLSLASAFFAAGDFKRNVIEDLKKRTMVTLSQNTENVAGVKLTTFNLRGAEMVPEGTNLIGLQGGGQAVSQARNSFKVYLESLIAIASLQTRFICLDQALKVTNRRVNALEFVQIPKIQFIIKWIESELDEETREDFFRLKKVTDNKKTKKAEEKAEAEMKEKNAKKDDDPNAK